MGWMKAQYPILSYVPENLPVDDDISDTESIIEKLVKFLMKDAGLK